MLTRKKTILLGLLIVLFSVSANVKSQNDCSEWLDPQWTNFKFPEINFQNLAAGTKGSDIYTRVVPNPEIFIQQHAQWVAQILYWKDDDYMPDVQRIVYTLENVDGISAKSGAPPEIRIFYSSRWIESSQSSMGDERVMYETRGVLYHELTHGYQLSPVGAGGYSKGTEFWAFIEGLADAVRYQAGFFPLSNRRIGGHWLDGYQTTGFFLQWLTSKDPDFIRKFNRSAIEVVPWSFDAAMKHIFGESHSVDGLWEEYQNFLEKSLLPERKTCANQLKIKNVTASSQVNDAEGASMAVDGSPRTKWCATSSAKWLEVEFEKEADICQWLVLHAGAEHQSYITSNFKLQRFDNGGWIDVDIVLNNKENLTDRTLTAPVRASKVRLLIGRAEQTTNSAARIYEFRVFGNLVE